MDVLSFSLCKGAWNVAEPPEQFVPQSACVLLSGATVLCVPLRSSAEVLRCGLFSSCWICRGSSVATPKLSVISNLCVGTELWLVCSRMLDGGPRCIDFSSAWGVGFCLGYPTDYLWRRWKHGKRGRIWMWSRRASISWRWLVSAPCMGTGPLERGFIYLRH